jgi:hypothetical protein
LKPRAAYLMASGLVGELLDMEDLAHGHPHDGNGDPVPGLVDAALGIVRPDLAAPGVARERRELRARDPIERLESEAGGVAAGIAIPAAGLETALHLSGAHDHVVPALDGHALRPRGIVEILARDAVSVLERLLAARARHIEQDAAADHLVLGLLDPAFLRARRGHLAAIVTVPHGVFEEDVAEPVPLRSALERHGHHVIGRANAALVEDAGIGVGAGADHGVDGIAAAHRGIIALRPLRAGMVEIQRQRDHLSLSHQRGGSHDIFGTRVVKGADLVVRSPFAPVLVLLRRLLKILSRDFPRPHEFLLAIFRAPRLR